VHAQSSIRFNEGKAPFHKNRNSHSDAYIFFSAIDYLKRKKIQSFAFCTRNINDFGDPKDPQKLLHPDLCIEYTTVEYYTQIGWAISELKKELGDGSKDFDDNDVDFNSQFNLLNNPEQYKLIDQLNLSLDHHYDELRFVPTHILTRLFPFKLLKAKYSYSYASSFQINSNNEELLRFFKSFRIGKNNSITFKSKKFSNQVKDSRSKVLKIVKKLNHNLIYDFATIGGEEVDIRLKKETQCGCVRCSYNNLDFYTSYNLLKNEPYQSHTETMKHAYIHFQFGNFIAALKLFYYVYHKSKSEGKYILPFICLYNLKRLKQYIRGHHSAVDKEIEEIINKVNRISLRTAKVAASHQSPFIENITNWIADNEFFNDAHKNVIDVLEKIRDHYHSQIKGGFSNNSNYHILVSHFAELDQFLDQNFLIFNNYSDFEGVVDKLLEGLLMIHSFNKHQRSRIDFINEYLLLKIITFTKRETIIKFYKRFHLLSLRFRSQENSGPSFEELALKFFSDYSKLKSISSEEKLTFFFWEKYHKIFDNILLILSLSDKKIDLTAIASQLSKIIKDEDFIRKFEADSIADFLRTKGKYISDKVFQEIITACIDNPKLHSQQIFSAIKLQVSNHHKNLIINDEPTFAAVKEKFLEKCSRCNSFHRTDILIKIIPILSDNLKKEIQQAIVELLKKDFQWDVYYLFAIYGFIDYKLFYKKFLDQAPPPPNGKTIIRHPFNQGDASFNRLSEILNMSFKYNIDLNNEEHQKYKGISPYYDWLLDMESFNYKKFEPLWILEYQTVYYLRKIFKNKKVKEYLISFLKKTKHEHLSQLFIEFSN
jgi:hypothetical protein